MRRRGGVQAVECFRDHAHGGVEADAELRDAQVVVDRLRNPDRLEARLVQGRRHAQRVVTADRDHRVDAVATQNPDHGRDSVLHLQRVGARGAQDRAAKRKDAAHVGRTQLFDGAAVEAAGPAVLDAADGMAELERSTRDSPDGRVQSGRVSTTGEDSDAHADRLTATHAPLPNPLHDGERVATAFGSGDPGALAESPPPATPAAGRLPPGRGPR